MGHWNENIIIRYQLKDIFLEPDEFNSNAIALLKKEYSHYIKLAFDELIVDLKLLPGDYHYYAFTERHLFPAFLIGDYYQILNEGFIEYCKYFILGYSIPILKLNTWLDTESKISKIEMNQMYAAIYGSQMLLNKIPQALNVSLTINEIYYQVLHSIGKELNNRFLIPKIELIFDKLISYPYYRSICGYFSASVTGALTIANIAISSDLKTFLYRFGVLRQVIDEICDVEEDLSQGIVTLPVAYSISKERDLSNIIINFWNQKCNLQFLIEKVREANGFESSFLLASKIYRECKRQKGKLIHDYPFVDKLFVAYDLKLCQLLRLRRNNWKENLPVSSI